MAHLLPVLCFQNQKEGKMRKVLVAAILILGLYTTNSFAQLIRIGDSSRAKEKSTEFYYPQAAEIVSGKVISTEKIIQKNGKSKTVRMTIKSDSNGEFFTIYFSPGWDFEKHGMKVEPNDRVLIRGSKTIRKGTPAIIAAEVRIYRAY
jgi:hypothetical protein